MGKILTTPIAFISRIPIDPFMTAMHLRSDWLDQAQRKKSDQFSVISSIRKNSAKNQQFEDWFREMRRLAGLFPSDLLWSMESCGPDLTWWHGFSWGGQTGRVADRFIYDPTNGTTSQGQLVYSSEGWISPAKK